MQKKNATADCIVLVSFLLSLFSFRIMYEHDNGMVCILFVSGFFICRFYVNYVNVCGNEEDVFTVQLIEWKFFT